MSISHADIPEDGLHEPKGVSTATSGQVYVADGLGSGEHKDLFDDDGNVITVRPTALLHMTDNSTPTSVSDTATDYLISGTWSVDKESFFEGTEEGKLTYTGSTTKSISITARFSLSPDSGTDQSIYVKLYINGVEETGARDYGVISSGDVSSLIIIWEHDFETDDYIEFYVQNSTAANDITVADAVMRTI